MKNYNVVCPVCGAINYNLYLEETNGWMECDSCGCIMDLRDPAKRIIPVFKEQQVTRTGPDQFAAAYRKGADKIGVK